MCKIKSRKNCLNREIECHIHGYDTRGEYGDQYNGEQTWECSITFEPYSRGNNYILIGGGYTSFGGIKKDCKENMIDAIQQEIIFLHEVLKFLKEEV